MHRRTMIPSFAVSIGRRRTQSSDSRSVIACAARIRASERLLITIHLRASLGPRVQVECNLGERWAPGTVEALNHFGQDGVSPYSVKLDSSGAVLAPRDDDSVIRRAAPAGMETRLRFALGERVEANVEGKWEAGRVVSLYYRANEGFVSPYQVQLATGTMVYAPRDDDSVIRREHRPKADKMLRFAVGDRVECNLGKRWERGTVVALNYYNEGGVISSYQAQLDSGKDVFAPGDSDDVIRLENRPTTHPRLRFAVGERVECNMGDHWELGTVAMLMYYGDGGRTAPYQVKLDSGGGVFAPNDDDSVIRRPAKTPAAQKRPAVAAASPSAGSAGAARASKLAQRRVGRQASTIGLSGSKLGGAKRGKPQRAAAHKSTLPEARDGALARWRAVSEREL